MSFQTAGTFAHAASPELRRSVAERARLRKSRSWLTLGGGWLMLLGMVLTPALSAGQQPGEPSAAPQKPITPATDADRLAGKETSPDAGAAVTEVELPALSSEDANRRAIMVGRALSFLDGQQSPDGSYSNFAGTGPTSMIISAMLRHQRNENHPVVAKGIGYILENVQPDGGIYADKSIHRNYETALAMMCLVEVDSGKKYAKQIQAAAEFLKNLQWDQGEQKEKDDMFFGGAGYGSHTRPDMSNTSYLVDALKAAGANNDDPNLQNAITFISRCQNHESEFNKTEFATGGPKDGGFFYTAAAGGETKVEGTLEGGGLRSYGSMTYAGLKSMLYAGVDKNDTRVQAALTYLKSNYDLKSNPGVGAQGLYYYYHVFAKALSALGEPTFVDANDQAHDWRNELITELSARQLENGSWINQESNRWMEGDPNLVTAYALLALSHAK